MYECIHDLWVNVLETGRYRELLVFIGRDAVWLYLHAFLCGYTNLFVPFWRHPIWNHVHNRVFPKSYP